MLRKSIATIAIISVLTPALAFAQAPAITVQGPSCAAPASNVKVVAAIDTADSLEFARVLFRAEGTTCDRYEYWVEMVPGTGNNWWALLPVIDQGVERFTYRVWAKTRDGLQRISDARTVPVQAACTVPAWNEQELRYASNIVIGKTDETQADAPCGFLCNGIGHVVSPAGLLGANEACRAALIAAGLPVPTGVAAGTAASAGTIGMAMPLAFILGAAGMVAFANDRNDDKDDFDPVSPARP